MLTYHINWKVYLRRLWQTIIMLIASIAGFVYCIFNTDLKFTIIYLISFGIISALPFLINFLTIKLFKIDNDILRWKFILSEKEYSIQLSEISHFYYYNNPVEKYNFLPFLELYIKTKFKHTKKMRIDLCFAEAERFELLSILHQKGFRVILFESLKDIQESEHFKTKQFTS